MAGDIQALLDRGTHDPGSAPDFGPVVVCLGWWARRDMNYAGFSLCEGVGTHTNVETLDHLLRMVELADHEGMDGWFFAEHHSNPAYSLTPSPNLLIAAASARTERIRLGNMVTVLPYHHPLRAAEEIRLLDALTHGRLEVGLARGGVPHEQAAYGLPSAEKEQMLEAGLQLLLRLLTEESVDYDVGYWRGTAATAVPEATQRPHPPMWLAAVSEPTIEVAARFGMNCATSLSYPALLQEQMAVYRDAWERYRPGTPPGRVGAFAFTVVASTEAEAVRHGKRFVEEKVGRFLSGFRSPPPRAKDCPSAQSRRRLFDHISRLSFDEWMEEGLIVFGSVDQCVEQVAGIRDRGVDMLSFWLQFSELDFDFADESLRLLCQEVIPRVKERSAVAAPAEVGD